MTKEEPRAQVESTKDISKKDISFERNNNESSLYIREGCGTANMRETILKTTLSWVKSEKSLKNKEVIVVNPTKVFSKVNPWKMLVNSELKVTNYLINLQRGAKSQMVMVLLVDVQ